MWHSEFVGWITDEQVVNQFRICGAYEKPDFSGVAVSAQIEDGRIISVHRNPMHVNVYLQNAARIATGEILIASPEICRGSATLLREEIKNPNFPPGFLDSTASLIPVILTLADMPAEKRIAGI